VTGIKGLLATARIIGATMLAVGVVVVFVGGVLVLDSRPATSFSGIPVTLIGLLILMAGYSIRRSSRRQIK
jgi:hypothetical protein